MFRISMNLLLLKSNTTIIPTEFKSSSSKIHSVIKGVMIPHHDYDHQSLGFCKLSRHPLAPYSTSYCSTADNDDGEMEATSDDE